MYLIFFYSIWTQENTTKNQFNKAKNVVIIKIKNLSYPFVQMVHACWWYYFSKFTEFFDTVSSDFDFVLLFFSYHYWRVHQIWLVLFLISWPFYFNNTKKVALKAHFYYLFDSSIDFFWLLLLFAWIVCTDLFRTEKKEQPSVDASRYSSRMYANVCLVWC